jgi:hypothetical protein
MLKKNQIIKIFILAFIFYQNLFAQIGLGVTGAYAYPGLQSSKQFNIHFAGGIGYGFFIKHDFFKIAEKKTYLRYLAFITNHRANLPGAVSGSNDSDYRFSNLSIDLLYEFFVKEKNKYYTGLSLNLLQTLSEGKFRETYSGSTIYPSLCIGSDYYLVEGFDAFAELHFGIGKTDAGPEDIPISGISFLIGITMYISE